MNKIFLPLVCCLVFVLFGTEISASAEKGCKISCAPQLSLKGEYLYWRAFEEDENFSKTITTSFVSEDLSIEIKDTDNPGFKWNSGFRLGLGYTPRCYSLWSFNLEYTHFSTSGDHDKLISFNNDLTDRECTRSRGVPNKKLMCHSLRHVKT